MDTIREIKKVKNHQVLIDLPEDYENEEIEIIILPLTRKYRDNTLSELLLKGPVWTEQEVKDFNDNIHKGYKNWKLKEF